MSASEPPIVIRTELSDLGPCRRGKVRDLYDLGDRLLIVATDRVSAFDVVLPGGIPDKGRILTRLSAFWFERMAGVSENHYLTIDPDRMPGRVRAHRALLEGRSMLVRKCRPYPVEAIVRGYLAGSGYREYLDSGRICGVPLPAGLTLGSPLPEPIFTPSTKAESGHDENISFEALEGRLPAGVAREIRRRSLALYARAALHAAASGILLADTKFEFGEDAGRLVLIDELLSPDSSRFWPAEGHRPGAVPRSLDKQIVRDHLEGTGWDKRPPAPELPAGVVDRTAAGYREILERLTGRPLREGGPEGPPGGTPCRTGLSSGS